MFDRLEKHAGGAFDVKKATYHG